MRTARRFRLEHLIVVLLLLCQGLQAAHWHHADSSSSVSDSLQLSATGDLEHHGAEACLLCWSLQSSDCGSRHAHALTGLAACIDAAVPVALFRGVLSQAGPPVLRGPPSVTA